MKKDTSTVIEIADGYVKMMQSRMGSIVAAEVRPIKNASDEELQGALTHFLLARNVDSDNLIFILPRRSVILKQMELPSKAS